MGSWEDVQGSGTYISSVWQQKWGGDGGDGEDPGEVSPSDGQTYFGDDGKMCGGRDVGISPSGGGARISGLILHTGVHSETAGNHCGTVGMPPHLCALYRDI